MYAGARLIVSSGYSSDPVMADHLAYGFRGVLPKPYRVEGLEQVVRQVLAARNVFLAPGEKGNNNTSVKTRRSDP